MKPKAGPQRSAIDKLLDQEHARKVPDTLHGVGQIGLNGMEAIDDGLRGFRRRLFRTVTIVGIRGSRLLERTGEWIDQGLHAVGEAEKASVRSFNARRRLWRLTLRRLGK
jgi:hypothetical protein